MSLSLPRILICALGGSIIGILGILCAGFLLCSRSLAFSLSQKVKWLLAAAMLVPGAAVGAITKGLSEPVVGLLLLFICLTVSLTDVLHRIIPNEAVLGILILKLLGGIPSLCGLDGFIPFDVLRSFIGLAACFIVFSLPGLFGKKVGAGDIKLAAAMGFFLGIYHALLAVMLMGLLVIVYSVFQRKMPFLAFLREQIPMGPFIAAGLFAAYLVSLNIAV